MSKEELNEAYSEGRITRRAFTKGIAALGGALGAGILLEAAAGAQGETTLKKAPAKKVAAKKATPKKPTVPPGLAKKPAVPVPPELG